MSHVIYRTTDHRACATSYAGPKDTDSATRVRVQVGDVDFSAEEAAELASVLGIWSRDVLGMARDVNGGGI